MTATVKIWNRRVDFPDERAEWPEPDKELEMEPRDPERWKLRHPTSVDPHYFISKDISYHSWHAFYVECDEPVTLNIYTNDSYHDPDDWGRPVEGGLTYLPDDGYAPFACEIWGRIVFWVQEGHDR